MVSVQSLYLRIGFRGLDVILRNVRVRLFTLTIDSAHPGRSMPFTSRLVEAVRFAKVKKDNGMSKRDTTCDMDSAGHESNSMSRTPPLVGPSARYTAARASRANRARVKALRSPHCVRSAEYFNTS